MLSQVLRHDPVVPMRPDGAAHLDDLIRELRQKSRWRDLDAKSVEEVVRGSLHERSGRPRFEFLEDDQGQQMIRATGKHTFEAAARERKQEDVSRALVQYCRRVKKGNWVKEVELVVVAKQEDASVDAPAVLSILRSFRHNSDDRLRFTEWTDSSERWFKTTHTSKSPRCQTNLSRGHPWWWDFSSSGWRAS